MRFDISVILTLHDEGRIAHRTLRALKTAVTFAQAITTDLLTPDQITKWDLEGKADSLRSTVISIVGRMDEKIQGLLLTDLAQFGIRSSSVLMLEDKCWVIR